MILSELAASLPEVRIRGDGSVAVGGLAYDSRAASPGTLFFAVPGARTDGHVHVGEAVARGAVAVVAERALDMPVPQLLVPSVRRSMGPIAAAFFGRPSESMKVVGVTGTNGKTTTTFMLERAFQAAGMRTGLVGTVETRIGEERLPAARTTPEGIDLQRLFARMRDSGVGAVAMEVSSHGLELGRVDGTSFACAAFTNLTQDHLDFHGTMEAYFRAKALLFDGRFADRAVVNLDDPYGRRLLDATALPAITYGVESTDADVRPLALELDRDGSTVRAATPAGEIDLRVLLTGRFNVANALAAVATFVALEMPPETAAAGIAAMPGVPGRLERVEAGQPFSVLVDYAHTPDSLSGVLRTAREVCEGELTVVFGCGGDRDRGKRATMGEIAARLADRVIITSDNPRSEDPAAIIAEIERGARGAGRPYEVEADRRAAIRLAVARGKRGDVVVIAGKGHETGQQFADRTIPFDDRIIAREELER